MKERPIIFSTPMVQAILEGLKTQTRRVVKPFVDKSSWKKSAETREKEWRPQLRLAPVHHGYYDDMWCLFNKDDQPASVPYTGRRCPYGKHGDLLWVRETFCVWSYDNNDVWYKASPISSQGWHNETLKNNGKKWKPSIHMPKKYARIWLEIVGVRVERVQDISDVDAMAEGVKSNICLASLEEPDYREEIGYRYAFSVLWDSINGKKEGCSWADNPWVWIVEFKRVEGL